MVKHSEQTGRQANVGQSDKCGTDGGISTFELRVEDGGVKIDVRNQEF